MPPRSTTDFVPGTLKVQLSNNNFMLSATVLETDVKKTLRHAISGRHSVTRQKFQFVFQGTSASNYKGKRPQR